MQLPICGCGRVMQCFTTGQNVLTHTEDGAPYQLWAGDEYECGTCSAKVTLINSQRPIAEHWEPGFQRAVRYAEKPDARSPLKRAYYRDPMDNRPKNIAGVQLAPVDPVIQNAAPTSTVDSTTAETDDAEHHGSSTAGAPER